MLELVLQSMASGVAVGCIYGLIGIGFCVIYNASGIVNFAQGAFVMLGGMVASAALTIYGLPLPLAGVLAILVCAALGIILERIVVRPLWNRQSAMFVMILATLAAQIVIERLTFVFGVVVEREETGRVAVDLAGIVDGEHVAPRRQGLAEGQRRGLLVGVIADFRRRMRARQRDMAQDEVGGVELDAVRRLRNRNIDGDVPRESELRRIGCDRNVVMAGNHIVGQDDSVAILRQSRRRREGKKQCKAKSARRHEVPPGRDAQVC